MTRSDNLFLLAGFQLRPDPMQDSVTVPLYALWPGRNRFLCGGILRYGPMKDCGYNVCLWTTILIPTLFFFSLPAPVVWTEVSPAIVIVTIGLALLTFTLFVITSFSDPGYIPNKEVQVLLGIQDDVRRALGIPSPDLVANEKVYVEGNALVLKLQDEFDDRILLTEQLELQGYKYCTTCRIIRPPRAAHCADCNNCCTRHDHHCPFVNNCVGHRNYLFFTSFIVSALVLGVMIIFSIVLWMSNGQSTTFVSPLVIEIIGFVVGVPVGLLLLAAGGFWLYHIHLACRGQTTRENLRGRQPSSINPSGSVFSRPARLYPSLRTMVTVPVRSPS